MSECTPLPYQSIEPTPDQETQAVAQPVHPEPIPVYDAAFGHGELYAAYPATVARFPAGAIFTYQAADRTITIRVTQRGDVIFPAPHTAPDAVEPPGTAEPAPTYPHVPTRPETALPARATASERHPQQRQQANRGTQEADEKQKVILSGNVASTPSFRQTGKGLMAKFTLAEHPDVDKTEFHDVVAFGKRAEKLKDSLTKGEAIKVVGKQIMWQPQPTKKGKQPAPKPAILLWQLSRVGKNTGA